MTEKSVYQYLHYGFPRSPEVSSERRMWDFLMTRHHKSQKQYILVKQVLSLKNTLNVKRVVKHQSLLLTSLSTTVA